MQQRGEHTSTTIQLLLETLLSNQLLGSCNSCNKTIETGGCFPKWSVPRSYVEDNWGDPVSWNSASKERTRRLVWNGRQPGSCQLLVEGWVLHGRLWRQHLSKGSCRLSTAKSRCLEGLKGAMWPIEPLLGKDLETNKETIAVAMQKRGKLACTTIELLLETLLWNPLRGRCNSLTKTMETVVFSIRSIPTNYLKDNTSDPVSLKSAYEEKILCAIWIV
jgi:hypothetical protein